MNQDGEIRELLDEGETPLPGEIIISNETAGILRRCTRGQRERFYSSFKQCGEERAALNVARSRP
jgi:hypothetical protein